MNIVTINGVDSTEIQGLLIQNLPPITKPQMRTRIEEIDGRAGDLITNLGYSAYDKEFDIGLYGSFDLDQVMSFFNSSGTVTFSNEEDKYYYFDIYEQIDYESLIRFKTAKIKMHVQPFKYSNTDTDIEIYATETDAEGTNLTINNTENGASFLDMQLKGQTTQDGTPTPSAPVNVNVVTGNTSVKICNKNLWQNSDNSIVTTYGITLTTNDDNSVTMTGSATNSSIYFTNVKKIMASDIKDGNYTISFGNGSNTSFIAYRLRKYNGTTKTEIKSATTLPIANYTYTLNLKNLIDDDTIQVELDFVRYGTGANDQTLYPQIEFGNTATSYVAHQEQNYEINLGTNELCEINGYQDYIYKNNGNWYIHKAIGKKVLDNTLTYSYSSYFGAIIWTDSTIADVSNNTQVGALSNKALGISPLALLTSNGIAQNNSNNRILVKFDGVSSYNTDALAKQYFGSNNYTVYYILATPTDTQITDTNLIAQLEALRNASTYINQTNIITSGDLAPIIYVNVDTIDTNAIEVVNSGNIYSKPVVTITGIGTINLYLNDYQVFIIELGDTETTITLDVENMEAYNINTGQLMNRQVTGDYNNFIFNSGTNIITWSGTIASVQIVNYSRWI